MWQEQFRWQRLLDRLESGHWRRRAITLGGLVLISGFTFAVGLMLRPAPTPLLNIPLVVGSPKAMSVNGLIVRDPATMSKVVQDLNRLTPSADYGIAVQSCPNYVGQKYVLAFTYANGDRWTVIVERDGCENVTAGGYWPRTSAFSNPQLLKDLDAIQSAG